jgi:hypothetical protein
VADGTSTIRNGTRGSMAPNWKPLSQEDLTGGLGGWVPGFEACGGREGLYVLPL